MEQEDLLQLMAKYLNGTRSNEEAILFEAWMKASSANRKYYIQAKNIWENSHQSLNPNDISIEKALKSVLNRISKESKLIILWETWKKIAAIILIPIAIAAIFWNYSKKDTGNAVSYNELDVNYGTRSSLKLADGSKVWLNSGSTFRYPDKFINHQRTVYLTGEAYFEVNSDSTKPFIVQTPSLSVRATGTKFNVLAYTRDTKPQVTLLEGKVAVSKMKGNLNELLADLKPNQNLIYDTILQKFSVEQTDLYKHIAWKDGKLIFRNDPLVNVLKRIGILYNVQFELRGKEFLEYRYRATFQEEKLEDILKILKATSPIDYKIIERKPLPDGTFPPSKVIISIKK